MSSSSFGKRTNYFIFKDTIERVYTVFIDFSIFKQAFNSSVPYILKMTKGTFLNEPQAEFTIELSKLIIIQMRVVNVINTKYYKSHTFQAINMTNIKAYFSIVTKFYYNTCEDETMVITERHFPDTFSHLLLKNNYVEVKAHIHAELVRNALDAFPFTTYDCLVIGQTVARVWEIISDMSKLLMVFDSMEHKAAYVSNGTEEESRIILFNNSDAYITDVSVQDKSNSNIREIVYETYGDEAKTPKQRISIRLIKLEDNKCLCASYYDLIDNVQLYNKEHIAQMRRKLLIDLKSFFESDSQ